MEHEVTVTIDASPEEVWAVLADVERWAEWTASITSVEPLDAAEGGKAFGAGSRARVKQPGFPAATWTVTGWAPGKNFTWTARAAGVTTVAAHELAPHPDGTTTVTLRLRQSGPLAGLVALLFGSRTRRYVGMEAEGLKARTEAPASACRRAVTTARCGTTGRPRRGPQGGEPGAAVAHQGGPSGQRHGRRHAGGMGSGSIGEAVGESWLATLEVNAAFDRPWVDAAVGWLLADMAPAATVVDVGCGAGGAACAFAVRPEVDGVVAVDRDPRLVAVARRRANAEGVANQVRWACGEVGRLPLRARAADLAWASGVVHHVADQQAAVVELAALLRPGGVLALVEGGLPLRCLPHDVGVGRPGLEARLDEARARWFEDLRAELAGPPLPYGWPAALARAGLTDPRTRSYVAESTSPLGPVGRRIARQHLESARDELGDRLDADDRATVRRLLDPTDPASIDHRDDLTVTAVRTVHAATAHPS